MAHVDHIKSEIEALSPEDFSSLRDWIADRDWQRWDEQLEQDAKSGKLDFLREEAMAAKAKGELQDF